MASTSTRPIEGLRINSIFALREGFESGTTLHANGTGIDALLPEVIGRGLGAAKRQVHLLLLGRIFGKIVQGRVALDHDDVAVSADHFGDLIEFLFGLIAQDVAACSKSIFPPSVA